MKKLSLFAFALMFVWAASSCSSKDDPTPENDQEEVGTAWLIFTEVDRHDDHYHDLANPERDTVRFDKDNKPDKNHMHLDVGKTYRMELRSFDFSNKENQQSYVDRDDIHQAFITGAPVGVLEYVYADKKGDKSVNVGVTGYLTILKESSTFEFRYVMRHLNVGVKANIKASDWNKDPASFRGGNDVDLKFGLHPVKDDHGHGGEGGGDDHGGHGGH